MINILNTKWGLDKILFEEHEEGKHIEEEVTTCWLCNLVIWKIRLIEK